MAKRKKRQPFAKAEEDYSSRPPETFLDRPRGVFGFMKDHGVRETVESIIVAVVLALMFRAFEAEAFIIPTGSMAPSLQGQHMDVVCEECGYQYRAGASLSASNVPLEDRRIVTKTFCPICRYGMTMKLDNPDHRSNNGDRILVNKFVYDFRDPERYDVIVFKNPNNGKQNYIKRLIGLPGDRILIDHGDIYNIAGPLGKREIQRKPHNKIDVMLHLVDDTHHISKQLQKVGWPLRWNEWKSPADHWKVESIDGKPIYEIRADQSGPHWLRYRHLAPRTAFDERVYDNARKRRIIDASTQLTEWEQIEKGEIPPRIKNEKTGEIAKGTLIRDHYEYNDRRYRARRQAVPYDFETNLSQASHWVGDLAMDCEVEVKSDKGKILFDLVEGGVHFQCAVNLSDGKAEVSTRGDNGNVVFQTDDGSNPQAITPMNGPGRYKIRYAQIDDKVYLWVNGQAIEFDGSEYTLQDQKRPYPRYSTEDAGDAEPLGIASDGADLRVDRLRVLRDVYYVAPVVRDRRGTDIRNETGFPHYPGPAGTPKMAGQVPPVYIYDNPTKWATDGDPLFGRKRESEPIFELKDGWYFPMGDNSPASQDARIWSGPKYVDEDYMIGRAMFIYWPHSLNRPVRFFPNFRRMGFIR